MEERLYSGLAIVPIIRADRKTSAFKQLLGTGFFCIGLIKNTKFNSDTLLLRLADRLAAATA